MSSSNDSCLVAVSNIFKLGGGVGAVNRLAVHALSEKGYKINILALAEDNQQLDSRYVEDSRTSYRSFGGNKIQFIIVLAWKILFGGFDFILVDLINIGVIPALFSRFKLCKYYVWLFGKEVFEPNPDIEGQFGLKFANKRIAISKYTSNRVLERFPKLDINICPLALDPVIFEDKVDPDINAPDCGPLYIKGVDGTKRRIGDRLILHVGRWVKDEYRDKGQDVLIKAFRDLATKDTNAQLALVGEGPQKEYFLEVVKDYPQKIKSRIFMPGFVDNVRLKRLYEKAYVFAMPSIGEGFGLVYLEAMRYSIPCIAVNSHAAPELVNDGMTGLLIDDPNSHQEVLEALMWIMENPAECKKMGKAGYQLYCENYLYSKFRERFLKIIAQ